MVLGTIHTGTRVSISVRRGNIVKGTIDGAGFFESSLQRLLLGLKKEMVGLPVEIHVMESRLEMDWR
jgi:hypothetical protein